MPTQLSFVFRTKPIAQHPPPPLWVDVTQIGRAVGFITDAELSLALHDALTPLSTEEDGDYDQRLYDALWLAHFQLSLDQSRSATFAFTFPRKHWKTEEITEASLRLRVEAHPQSVLVGLLPDF